MIESKISLRSVFAYLFLVSFLFSTLSASSIEDVLNDRLTGKELVKVGEKITVTGTLKCVDNEWFLETEEKTYEIHLGNHEYRKTLSLNLEEGKTTTVSGFHKNSDIAVTNLILDSKTYSFRNEDGSPKWSGMGHKGCCGGNCSDCDNSEEHEHQHQHHHQHRKQD